MSTDTAVNRDEILNEIGELERRILELKSLLPSALKRVFHFRCKPDAHVFVYAASEEQAKERLHARMDKSYGKGVWKIVSTVVKIYDDIHEAALASPGSFMRSLGTEEALEFIEDWTADQQGKKEPSQKCLIQLDVENYEYNRKMRTGEYRRK